MAKKKKVCLRTEFEIRVRRDRYNLHPISTETVGPYLAQLSRFKRRIEEIDWDAERALGCSEKGISERKNALEEEINHCKFFLEINKRRTIDLNFDKWIFIPKDDRWYHRHDAWVRDNGKIVAKVEIIPTTSRTKLRVSVEDSAMAKNCGFVFAPYGEGHTTHAFQKEERILKEIADAKVALDTVLMENTKPRTLNELLEQD